MASDVKIIPMPMGVGMDQSFDEYMAPMGNLRESVNTRVRKGGAVEQRKGIQAFAPKRPGNSPANTQPLPTGTVTFVNNGAGRSLLGQDGFGFAFDPSSSSFSTVARLSSARPVQRTSPFLAEGNLFGTNFVRDSVAMQTSSGERYVAHAVEFDSDTTLCTISLESGQAVAQFNLSGTRGRVIASDKYDRFYFFVQSGVEVKRDYVDLSPTGMTRLTPSTVATLTGSGAGWDVTAIPGTLGSDTSDWGIIRHDPLASGAMAITTYDWLTPVATGIMASTGTGPVTFHASQDYLVAGNLQAPTGSSSAVVVISDREEPASEVASVTLDTGDAGELSAPFLNDDGNQQGEFFYCIGRKHASLTQFYTRVGTVNASSAHSSLKISNVLPISAPGKDRDWWAMSSVFPDASTQQSRSFLLRSRTLFTHQQHIELSLPVAGLSRVGATGFAWTAGLDRTTRVAALGKNRWAILPLQLRSQDDGLWAMDLYRYEQSQDLGLSAVTADDSLYAGGQPVEINRSLRSPGISGNQIPNAPEVGFIDAPVIAEVNGIGGSIEPGTRQYRAVYEYISVDGTRHRSAPSAAFTVTNTSAQGWSVVCSRLSVTLREDLTVLLHIYRTVNGGVTYQRVTTDSGGPPADPSTGGARRTFNDTTPDTDILSNEFLYTDGGVLDNSMAPACRFMTRTKDRLWCGGLFERELVQFSKRLVPREPVQFTEHNSHKLRMPVACTGFAESFGAMVLFGETVIFIAQGNGPNNQGQGSFSLTQVSDDIGCIDHRSVVSTSVGVFFQSRRGLYLLPRGFGPPQHIRAIQHLMSTDGDGYTEVIGADTRESSDEKTARFVLRNPTTMATIVAVFEIGSQTWSYDKIPDELGQPMVLSAIGNLPDGYGYGQASGAYPLIYEYDGASASAFDTVGTTTNRIVSELRWSKASPFGPAGVGRIQAAHFKAYSANDAQFDVSLTTDRSVQTHTFSGVGSGAYYRRICIKEPETSEFTAHATFSTGAGSQKGTKMLSLTLEASELGGARRPGSGEQV